MDWKAAIREEKAMLKSIVALLYALADLAELASCRSRAACSLISFILRPAEAAAWMFVDLPPGERPIPIVRFGDVRADMIYLARRFRMLTRILEYQAELACSCGAEDSGPSGLPPDDSGRFSRIFALRILDIARPVQILDTS